MKLGKGTILAIIETALFVIGACFFLLVLIIPANPVWALIAGLLFGLAGAIVWSCPLFVRMGQKIHDRIKTANSQTSAEDVAKKILADDDESTNYELHRADAYENYDHAQPNE